MNSILLQQLKEKNIFVQEYRYHQISDLEIKMPTIQRIRIDETVQDIIHYQLECFKTKKTFNYLGVINIHYCEEDSSWYLIDGQHRFESLRLLWKTYSHSPSVYFQFVKVLTIDELKTNYEMINKNTPLPEFSATIDKTIPERVYLILKTEYPTMWAGSVLRANRPHLSATHFQTALGYITDTLHITSVEELLQLVREQNDLMSADFWDFPDKSSITQKMIDKCKTSGLYLGLYKKKNDTYIYKWVKLLVRNRKKLVKPVSTNPFDGL